MGRTYRRAHTPSTQAVGTQRTPEPDRQDLEGNAAIAGVDEHNAEQGAARTTDPEAVAGSTHLAPGGRWDGASILDRWSQLDDSSSTNTAIDSRRCGAQAVVAPHVLAGAGAISAVATDARSHLGDVRDPDARLVVNRHRRTLDQLSRASDREHWTFSDLDELAETLYVIANDSTIFDTEGGTATNRAELDRITGLGVPEGEEVPRGGMGGFLDGIGAGGLMPQLPGVNTVTGERSIQDLPDSGHFNGPGRLAGLVGTLTLHRNAALIIGTAGPNVRNEDGSRQEGPLFPAPVPEEDAPNVLGSRHMDALAGVEHNRIAHGVTLGVDGAGAVYLYDPWPREGAQRLTWPDRGIEAYFTGDWMIMSRMAAADGASRPGTT